MTVHFDEKVPHMHLDLFRWQMIRGSFVLTLNKKYDQPARWFNQNRILGGYSLERGTAKAFNGEDVDKFKKDEIVNKNYKRLKVIQKVKWAIRF